MQKFEINHKKGQRLLLAHCLLLFALFLQNLTACLKSFLGNNRLVVEIFR
ncbi:hypothetical protein HMPREF0027_1038 [Actinobacillus ureae ATCC 25976]|uniref:Uncharacterized protein n=1 Tax=Actinobacillus ureae ATCC 25976 TaxID=887324 RepID=E8KGS1_9PAST|nr:hypothetical protein HMPREF0027_1038 [Actinobacillus ureae ATCC 25976]